MKGSEGAHEPRKQRGYRLPWPSIPLSVHFRQPLSVSASGADAETGGMSDAQPRSRLWELLCRAAEIDPDGRGALDAMFTAHPVIGRGSYQRIREGSGGRQTATVEKLAEEFSLSIEAIMAALRGELPNPDDPRKPEVAHGLSHQPEQTPTLTREKLMSGVEVNGEFWVELWDDAIGQELPRGTLTLWDAGLQPEVGDFVLIRTEDGRPHVRVYGESLAHGWQGKPLHSDYEAIPGAGAKVLAVFLSAKVRRSQLRR